MTPTFPLGIILLLGLAGLLAITFLAHSPNRRTFFFNFCALTCDALCLIQSVCIVGKNEITSLLYEHSTSSALVWKGLIEFQFVLAICVGALLMCASGAQCTLFLPIVNCLVYAMFIQAKLIKRSCVCASWASSCSGISLSNSLIGAVSIVLAVVGGRSLSSRFLTWSNWPTRVPSCCNPSFWSLPTFTRG